MTQEALRLALEALEGAEALLLSMGLTHLNIYGDAEKAITAIKEALAQPEQEPVAWPCLIAEADFSEDTVTLAMQCTDYKVSAGKHWLSNTTPPQRTWVGLTDEEMTHANHHMVEGAYQYSFKQGAKWAEAKLKQKNGFAEEINA